MQTRHGLCCMLCLYHSFLSVVPLNLLSATEASGDTGMTHYLMEAHKQVIVEDISYGIRSSPV